MTVPVKVVDLITARNGIRAAFVALRGGYVLSVPDDADRALAALDIAIGRLGLDPTYSDRSSAGVAARPATLVDDLRFFAMTIWGRARSPWEDGLLKLLTRAADELEAAARPALARPALPDVTRLDVIDEAGRIYSRWGCQLTLSYQDEGRTLKVFVADNPDALHGPPVGWLNGIVTIAQNYAREGGGTGRRTELKPPPIAGSTPAPRIPPARPAWQPIATVPQDRRWVLVWQEDNDYQVYRFGPGLIEEPDDVQWTHWQALPPPPEEPERQK